MPNQPTTKALCEIAAVMRRQDGTMLVYDSRGRQLPKYQGHYSDAIDAIRAVYSGPIEDDAWTVIDAALTEGE